MVLKHLIMFMHRALNQAWRVIRGSRPGRNRVQAHASTSKASKAHKTTPYGNTLPDPQHVTLWSKQLKPGRLVIIGDVHGCHEELQRLLSKVSFNKESDNLIFVGDLVNKLRKWHKWRDDGVPLPDKVQWMNALQPEDAMVLEHLPFTIHLPEYGILVVHAAFIPTPIPIPTAASLLIEVQGDAIQTDVAASVASTTPGGHTSALSAHSTLDSWISSQDLDVFVHARNMVAKVTGQDPGFVSTSSSSSAQHTSWTPLTEPTSGVPWASVWPGPQHVFFGHDARRRLQLERHATGLDTGCLYGGKLTAAVLPPLEKLRSMSPVVARHTESVQGLGKGVCEWPPGVTREDLQVELVCVEAERVHVAVPGGGE